MFDRFRSLSQERQLGMAALVMLLLATLLIGAWLWLRTPYQPLFTQLRAADAAAIVDELDHSKTPYRLADGGTTVLVPAERIDATRLALMNGNLALKGTVGFELFNKSDMGLTDFAQRINYQRALTGELERTIMSLDGVEQSRVHLSLGEDRIFREDRVAPKASVTIRMRAGTTLAPAAAVGIQRLVAASVAQLEPTDVVIVDESGQVISASAVQPAPPAQPEAAEQKAIGSYYEARVREALDHAYLADHVGVQVRAGLAERSGNGRGDADWNPAARDFPLRVTLDVPATLDVNARQDVRGIAAGAVSFDASRGDAIDFGTIVLDATSPSLPPVPAPTPRPHIAAPLDKMPSPLILTTLLWPMAIAIALLAVLAAVTLHRRSGRPLSIAERARTAARLRTLLQEGDGDGTLA